MQTRQIPCRLQTMLPGLIAMAITTAYVLLGVLVLLPWPWASAHAQEPAQRLSDTKPDILIIEGVSLPHIAHSTQVFKTFLPKYLAETGITPKITTATFSGDVSAIASALTAQLKNNATPDLIIAKSTFALRAVLQIPETADIPIVFSYVTDPVAEGVVARIGQTSKKNITGFLAIPSIQTKLDMARTIISNLDRDQPLRVGFLVYNYPASLSEWRWVNTHKQQHPEIDLIPIHLEMTRDHESIDVRADRAINAILSHDHFFDALWLAAGPVGYNVEFRRTVSEETGLSWLYGQSVPTVEAGAAFGLVSTSQIVGRELARRTALILDGTPANSMPIAHAMELKLPINIETMLKLGTVPPSSILELADSLIFKYEAP